MRVIFESGFDIIYLVGVVVLGIIMLRTSEKNPTRKLFGAMAVVLGLGDSFHLIPRIISLITDDFEGNAAALGMGKFVTSITMTVFYVLLYYVWRRRYTIQGRKPLSICIWVLAILRIGICLLPQNDWRSTTQPLFYGILRNIPFLIMGVIIIIIFAQEIKKKQDNIFRFMPLAIVLSFALYIPVVLWGEVYPLIGMLMIPKTLAYVWIVIMGFKLPKIED